MSLFDPPTAERSTPEEEAELARLVRSGCKKSAERLYLESSRWLVRMAVQFARRSSCDLEETIAHANLAFFEVIHKFDASRSRLTTFLSLTVPRRLQQHSLRDRLVRSPSSYKGEGSPAHDQVKKTLRPESLSTPTAIGRSLYDSLMSVDPEPEKQALDRFDAEAVRHAVRRLPEREREIVHRHFYGGETLEGISQSMGVTRERVRQLKNVALKSLKSRVAAAQY